MHLDSPEVTACRLAEHEQAKRDLERFLNQRTPRRIVPSERYDALEREINDGIRKMQQQRESSSPPRATDGPMSSGTDAGGSFNK